MTSCQISEKDVIEARVPEKDVRMITNGGLPIMPVVVCFCNAWDCLDGGACLIRCWMILPTSRNSSFSCSSVIASTCLHQQCQL